MSPKNLVRIGCLFLCVAVTSLFAQDAEHSSDTLQTTNTPNTASTVNHGAPEGLAKSNDIKLGISGLAGIEESQFVKGYFLGNQVGGKLPYPIWNHRSYVQLGIDAFIGDRLHIVVEPQVYLWSNTYPETIEGDHLGVFFRQWSFVSIADGEGIISFGDNQKPFLQFAAGVMPFKYNSDAYNLGEYLFRSGTYPSFVITSFDHPYATLAGIRLSSTLFENLRQDLLLTCETQVEPLYDWSLSYLVGYKLPSLLDIGAGASLYRCFPAAGGLTSPQASVYGANQYVDADGNTSFYTFKGIKLMGRASFDIKGVLPSGASEIMGKEDGKIFLEAAVLGMKNYPAFLRTADSSLIRDTSFDYYGDIKQRIPIMFGFNFPTFKVLDVLSIQGEWRNWPYLNSFFDPLNQGKYPVPLSTTGGITLADLKNSYLKWSVYAKKEVIKGFSVIGQIANDHTFHESYYPVYTSYAEAFIKHGDWGWWLKCQFAF